MLNKMIFTKGLSTKGDFWASYCFENETKRLEWIRSVFPSLQKEYSDISFKVFDLDGLQIGDKCMVDGEGMDIFTIKEIKKYSDNRYAFLMDTGWWEEVVKCHKPIEDEF